MTCMKWDLRTHLSGSVAERLSQGDVRHSWRTGGLPVIQRLSPLGSPGKKKQTGSTEGYRQGNPGKLQMSFLGSIVANSPDLFKIMTL